MAKKTYVLQEIATLLAAKLQGERQCVIEGIGSLTNAKPGQISFLHDARQVKHLSTTHASAVIVTASVASKQPQGNYLIVDNPYLAYAKVSALFNDMPILAPGVHKNALVGDECIIAPDVAIGAYVVIGNNVQLDAGVKIASGCVLGDGVVIGAQSRLCANVTLYHKVKIGERVLVHSGAVIGSDGFGNAQDAGRWHKICQLGTVVIGDDVEIGASTTIDRGAIENTVISNGVKIDNQVQIGHNVYIGDHTAIAGCVGIAGSTKIGRQCMIGGKVGIAGHIVIADRTIIAGMSSVGKSISQPGGIYASAIPAIGHRAWWRIVANLLHLDKLQERIKKLEKRLI